MGSNDQKNNTAAILIGAFIALTDAIGILLAFFGLDDFLVLDVITWPLTAIYFIYNKRGGWYNTAANLLELIPYVGALPIRTVGFLLGLKNGPKQDEAANAGQNVVVKKPKGTIAAPPTIK